MRCHTPGFLDPTGHEGPEERQSVGDVHVPERRHDRARTGCKKSRVEAEMVAAARDLSGAQARSGSIQINFLQVSQVEGRQHRRGRLEVDMAQQYKQIAFAQLLESLRLVDLGAIDRLEVWHLLPQRGDCGGGRYTRRKTFIA